MGKNSFILLALVLSYSNVYGQLDKYWQVDDILYRIDKNDKVEFVTQGSDIYEGGVDLATHDLSGNLGVYFSRTNRKNNLKGANNTFIKNNVLYGQNIRGRPIYISNDSGTTLIQYELEKRSDSRTGGFFAYHLQKENGAYTIAKVRKLVSLPDWPHGIGVTRLQHHNYLIQYVTRDYLYLATYKDDVFAVHDSVALNIDAQIEPQFVGPMDKSQLDLDLLTPKVSNKIIVGYNYYYQQKINGTSEYIGGQSGLLQYSFDTLSYELLSNPAIVDKNAYWYTDSHFKWLDIRGNNNSMEYSPNDSVLYVNYAYRSVVYPNLKRKMFRYKLQQEKFQFVDSWSFDDDITHQTKLGPSGNILMFENNLLTQNGLVKRLRYTVVEQPNNFADALSTKYRADSSALFQSLYSHYHNKISFDYYNYIRLYKQIDYTCNASVTFRNTSDMSGGLEGFRWCFTNENGGVDTLYSKEPRLVYTKNGDYPYRCYAYSTKGQGYGEEYLDTLKIRIPEKPEAAFTATDTVVCAFSAAEFTNQSTALAVHTSHGEQWVWTFGDGESESHTERSRSVTHIYKKPGTYTVSLFYSNGYCDSTLVKNQYIKVVDAPAPGFAIDNNRGCTPFAVNITDTVTKNTTRKEYNFYDGRGWVDVPVAQEHFGVTYNVAGTYWITQRLYGYTGCVTQQDSARIYVTAGLTDKDTLDMLTASYTVHPSAEGALVMHNDGREQWRSNRADQREPIQLHWTSHEAAVQYRIARNGSDVAELEATISDYEDSVQRPMAYSYSVVGVDSCGTMSARGKAVSPMYLTGTAAADNSMAVVSFSPYDDLRHEQSYILFTEKNGGWEALSSLGTNTRYEDNAFLGDGSDIQSGTSTPLSTTRIEKCYMAANKYGILSNILCLPYKPVVFLPTAFSPNGDNLNDVYRPITFGITYYEAQIYNRYGQQIASFDQTSHGWDALDIPTGAYVVTMRAKGTDNQWYNVQKTVTVVR